MRKGNDIMELTLKQKLHNYYLEHKDRWKQYYKPPQTQEERAVIRLQKQTWKEEHPEKTLWSNAKYRATRDGIEFNLKPSDIVVPTHCPYLGIELNCKKGHRHNDALMSLDRVDSSKGYIKGNVEVISYKANRMKNNATEQELLVFAKNVIKRYG